MSEEIESQEKKIRIYKETLAKVNDELFKLTDIKLMVEDALSYAEAELKQLRGKRAD